MSLLDKTNLLITPNAVKSGKLYSVIPSNGTGDCTVVRNTTATRVNSLGLIQNVAANVPRLNYNIAGGAPSILVEGQRTNLFNYSSQFNNSYWGKSGVSVVADNAISPDGSQNADTLNFGASNGSEIQAFTAGSFGNTTQTISVFAKVLTGTAKFRLKCTHAGVSDYFSSNFIATEQWQKFTFSQPFNSGGNGIIAGILNEVAGGVKSVVFFGIQLENASSSSSYIPTINAAVTRNADVVTVAPPAGTVKITTTFSNDTTQVITSIPTTFTVPEGLIKQVLMQSSL